MITQSLSQIRTVLHQLLPLLKLDGDGKLSCQFCHWQSMTFEQLYQHVPLYHTNEPELAVRCQLCERSVRNYAVHLHEEHAVGLQPGPSATPLYAFALVVCQRKDDMRFLVVQESGTMGYWLPGGRVEVGEQLDKAAERETLEEAGVKIRITGILKIEFIPKSSSNRLRIIFFAEPLDVADCEPKSIPDYER